ncbi:endonuclease [Altererythrobacter buctensis]|uniref:Endonuclease n=2 Tax=Alteraurantiacibacter buctensis TaxID=1503981 RepID=A0A844YTA8_9SPHN|nr:endonuclease [Alteraurantiacibacter buctensis]
MTEELALDTKRSAFPFKAYKADEVKRRLEELFHGKCAYCETFYASQAPVDVEHYRPKGAVEGAPDHPGYWWLGMEWSNLLPSCLDCNRRRKQRAPDGIGDLNVLYKATQSGKKDSFPVAGVRADSENAELAAEHALLLDPTRDDPSAHLTYWLGNDAAGGLILPKRVDDSPSNPIELAAVGTPAAIAAEAEHSNLSVRGAVSIQVYGLNRMRLVQDRARLIQRMRFLEILAINLGDIANTLEQAGLVDEPVVSDAIRSLKLLQGNILSEMRGLAAPDMPYSTLAAAYLADFKARLSPPVAPEYP